MKLFIKEQLPFFLFSCVQFLLMMLLFGLNGSVSTKTLIYAFFLWLFIYALFLFYRYSSHYSFYRRLSKPLQNLDESFQEGKAPPILAPLPDSLNQLLQSQYMHYKNEIQWQQRKMDEQNLFINQWVHHMKTPLSVIEMISNEEVDERSRSVLEETGRIRRGLEIALSMARLERFEQDFLVEEVPLAETVNQVVHEQRRYFIRSQVYPRVCVEDGIHVHSDAKWLQFILTQLLTNAIKYTSGHGKHVTISGKRDGRTVTLQIADDGIGIPKADIKRVFKPFYTGENGRHFSESTGMGLYLVDQVVKKLGHSLLLQSELNVGTTITITFKT